MKIYLPKLKVQTSFKHFPLLSAPPNTSIPAENGAVDGVGGTVHSAK
jgi:hypothetical protein